MRKAITTRTVAAALVTLCMLLLSAAAQAQLRGPLTITNNTNCAVGVCTANGSACVLIPANSQGTINIPCTTTAIGIRSCGGLRVIPLGQCISNVAVGNNCCADICFVTGIVSCTFFLSINPVPGPCPCPLN